MIKNNKIIVITLSLFIAGLTGCDKETENTDQVAEQSTVNDTVSTEPDTSKDVALTDTLWVEDEGSTATVSTSPTVDTPPQAEPTAVVSSTPNTSTATPVANNVEAHYDEMVGYGFVTQSLLICEGIDHQEFEVRRNKGLDESGFTSLDSNKYLQAFDKGVMEANKVFPKSEPRKASECEDLFKLRLALESVANSMN